MTALKHLVAGAEPFPGEAGSATRAFMESNARVAGGTQNLTRAPNCITRGPPTESVILPKSVVAPPMTLFGSA